MIKRIYYGKQNAAINLSRCNRKYIVVIGLFADVPKSCLVLPNMFFI